MANRVIPFNTFASLTTALASNLDANFAAVTTSFNDASLGYTNAIATDTGSANNYIVTCPFGSPTAYNPGMTVVFLPANTNTGSSTITVNPLSSVPIVDAGGNPLPAGAIQVGIQAVAYFISGAFRLLTFSPGNLVSNQVNSATGTTTLTLNVSGASQITVTLDTSAGPSASVTVLLFQNVARGARINVVWTIGFSNQILRLSNACTDQAGGIIPAASIWTEAGTTFNLFTGGISGANSGVNGGVLLGGVYAYYPSDLPANGLRFMYAYH